jgi:hypothetical protein
MIGVRFCQNTMEEFLAFLSELLCAAALFGSDGNMNPEWSKDTGPVGGVVWLNKSPSVEGCPMVRYAVRFGRDDDAKLVDLSAFTRTTIDAMRSWPAPGSLPSGNRIAPYETTVVALEATVLDYQKERSLDGSDYRLVLSDPSGRTIVAKISSPDCAEIEVEDNQGLDLPESRFVAGLESSRAEVAGRLSPTTMVKQAGIRVRIVGIGMFEMPSGQSGEAPNGIQLNPVLQVSFDEQRMPVVHAPTPRLPRNPRGR